MPLGRGYSYSLTKTIAFFGVFWREQPIRESALGGGGWKLTPRQLGVAPGLIFRIPFPPDPRGVGGRKTHVVRGGGMGKGSKD